MAATNNVTEPVLGRNIRAEMARSRFTQQDLADTIGVSQSAASARLRGDTPFKAPEVETIAGWLRVPISKLYGE